MWNRRAHTALVVATGEIQPGVYRFAELTEKAIRRGSLVSVPDVQAASVKFLEAWNRKPKPFIWAAKVEDILRKLERARANLEQIKPGYAQPRAKRKANPA